MIHPVLERQIKRLRRKDPNGELQLDKLIELVSVTYGQLEDERTRKDLSLETMSKEMLELHQRAMDRHESYVATLVEEVVDGVITMAENGEIVGGNAAAARIFGVDPSEIAGQQLSACIRLQDGAPFSFKRAEEEAGSVREQEVVGVRINGEVFPAELSFSKLSQGEETLYLVILRDISQRKETERMLIEAKDNAEALAQSKADFLSTMSHEIRTPLNAVIGMTGLLEETQLDDEQHEYVNTIKTGGETLLSIINDILDFSKIESNKLDLEFIPIPVIQPIEDVMELLAGKAHMKGLNLFYDVDSTVPPIFHSDITRLRQVLVNLVGNAIKFTDKGQVVVRVSAEEVSSKQHRFTFRVQDTGIGIPRERIDRLFQSFSQVDASTTRKYGGSGLGLAICKGIVEALGGEIWVESELGEGSSFNFSFLANFESEEQQKIHELKQELVGRSVLFIDDNEVNLRILDKQLSNWGMKVYTECHPERGLALLKDGLQVDMLVTDHMMAEMSGNQVIQEVRKFRSKAELPIILYSSGIGRIPDGLETEINGFLSKPGRQESILRTLVQVSQHGETKRRVQKNQTEWAQFPKLKVLLVEDNSVNQRVALKMLSRMGIKADIAGNGEEAVLISSKIQYDLILMDMMMPVMDGITATGIIRKYEESHGYKTVMVALTANVMRKDVERCLEAGMDDFLAKPVRMKKLEEVFLRWTREFVVA